MKKVLSIGAALAALVTAGAASAATVTVGPGGFNDGYATAVTYNNDAGAAQRGTADGRSNGLNALGANDGKFFEIGYNDEVVFTFGTSFVSPGATTEVTFNNRPSYVEQALVYVGMLGNPASWVLVNEAPISNANATSTFTFAGGPFDALKFVHTGPNTGGKTGGFDIDSVRVTPAPVPLPAAGIMLVGALGGLSFLRRKQRAA
ncbi:VPLPA-CTERM sorting domain-containing protein [Paracoccus sp. TK19116]|uniref:VPLPA-CTERM sorting domain-containing protein n=1 Tax=Paracoccus albicereus TaxID=2922394 RepID=A0ABT1MNT4_9RHOB|nr:VPLPA-CTERM sorting domain-containing protein [Paracoccus albicereus]MCQ0969952.1 VPLPA-CTERM sorting domain-containing protein [Paracoccus albicereus]